MVSRRASAARLARLPQMQPLGDAVDKQVDHLELGQIAAGKRLVFRPQSLRDLAHRRAAQQRLAALVGKQRFDIARGQSARIHLNRQRLQFLAPAADDLAQPGGKRHRAVRDLRRSVFDHALRCLQPTRAVAIAIAGARSSATHVILPSQRVRGFALQAFLDDQPGRKAHQLGA
jgi:hypothetical protein